MKIGIDTFGLAHGNSGLGSYLMSILKYLPETDSSQIELFGHESDRYTYATAKTSDYFGIDIKDDIRSERSWHKKKASRFCRKREYDIAVFTDGSRLVPPKSSVFTVAIVSSILSRAFENCSFFERKRIVKNLSGMDCIIASSMFLKKDLIRCGVKCPRIEIVHYGIDHSSFYPGNLEIFSDYADIKPFSIKKPYFIYGSRISSPEKKHIELIKAFTMFKEKTGLPHRLVLAGEFGACSEEVQQAAFNSSAASDIFLTGFFPRDGYPELYRNSELCIFPSVIEGVGLPVMEAMACGIPVACTKSGALQEIAGDCATYFDSDDIESIEQSIELIVTDEKARKKLVDSGLERSQRFSWKKAAEETVEIIKNVYRESRGH